MNDLSLIGTCRVPAIAAVRTCLSAVFIVMLSTILVAAEDSTPKVINSELSPPVRIRAGDTLIDVSIGHAAPHLRDFDGDGLPDLLVGEFGTGSFAKIRLPRYLHEKGNTSFNEGKLRLYKNVGKTGAPLFADFKYLRAGKEFLSIPTT